MLADPRSLEALDFARVRERVAGQTHAAQAHALALALEPVSDTGTVRRLVTQTAEMRTLVRTQNFSLTRIEDVDEGLEIAQRGSALPAAELRAIADALAAGGAAVRAIREAENVPALRDLTSAFRALPTIVTRITDAIDERGSVLDRASPALARMRRAIAHAQDDARDRTAAGRQFGEPCLVEQLLARLVDPVVGERLGELLDHRPLEPEVRIAHRMRRIGRQQVLDADIDAAGEGDAAVDHQELAMVAQVEERRLPRHVGMQEPVDRHARLAQLLVGARPEVAAADAIDQHPHRHATAMGTDQRLDEGHPRLIVAEDVARQPDAFLRRIDRREHRRIGVVAAAQQADPVARLGRQAGQPADRVFERRQRPGIGRIGRHLLDQEHVAALAPEPHGAPLHAVHAQRVVQDPADERRQPGDPHPRDRRADVALVEQDVNRHAARDGDMRHRGQFAQQPGEVARNGCGPPLEHIPPGRNRPGRICLL